MHNTIFNFRAFELCNCMIKKQHQNFIKRYCTGETPYTLEKKKIIHPYRKLHPWKSLKKFSQDLLDNVIYNKDGLVAINKPYGISARPQNIVKKNPSKVYSTVPDGVDYTLSDSIPFIAKELGYSELVIVKTPEKFISGVTLLAANKQMEIAIMNSYARSVGMKLFNKIYWIVTTKVPMQVKGTEHLCMAKKFNLNRSERKVVIMEKWSNNAEKRREVKILNVEFDVISNSVNNLSSLIEVKASTIKWHALRLFASTRLYSPILGDNIYANYIHKIGGKWLLGNPFTVIDHLPNIDPQLLELLYLSKARQQIIPCHIHARRVILPHFLRKETITLEAPLITPFDWTCKQLKFKNIPEFQEKEEEITISLNG